MGDAWQTLIDAKELAALLQNDRDVVVFDCRHQLTAPEAGQAAWAQAHIPGAFYAHLDKDLSGPVIPGVSGRHPLPDREGLADWLGQRGVSEGVQVVVYDDAGGAIAARLWWMLRWLGHHQAAVLDGGIQAWFALGMTTESDAPALRHAEFVPNSSDFEALTVEQIQSSLSERRYCLLDARDGARYRGEVEPFGPVAGHIPGAYSYPFADNLAHGQFKTIDALQSRFSALNAREDVVCYCGSGVTGCHNILAMLHAGVTVVPKLYTGSWSEWSLDSSREIATGAEP